MSVDDKVLIQCEDVGKKYCRHLRRSLWYAVKDMSADLFLFRSPPESPGEAGVKDLRYGEFWANRNVNFQLRRGDRLGLVGCNGAGKTTLLKMLGGLLKPDEGRITVRGKVGALIALGAGFNPILTGRENIIANGAVLGLSRAVIKSKFDEIVDFAEIHEFVDSPVQNYSSGMRVRLGFAIATAMEPDVLLLDEVLAVGDTAFRSKCYSRISQLQDQAAVVFVSHSMSHVEQVCNQVFVMDKGRGEHFMDVASGVRQYEILNRGDRFGSERDVFGHLEPPVDFAEAKLSSDRIAFGTELQLQIDVATTHEIRDCVLTVVAKSALRQNAIELSTCRYLPSLTVPEGKSVINLSLGPAYLKTGTYSLVVVLQRAQSAQKFIWLHNLAEFAVEGPSYPNVGGESCFQAPLRQFEIVPVDSFSNEMLIGEQR